MEFRFRQVEKGKGPRGDVQDIYVLELVNDDGEVIPLLCLHHNVEYSLEEVPLRVDVLRPEVLEVSFGGTR